MEIDKAMQVMQEHLNRSIDAKLMPLAETVAGLEMALMLLISALHQRGSLSLDEAERSLQGGLALLAPEHARGQSAATLRRLIQGIADTRSGGWRPPRH
jgi:hypothetical protein